MRLLMTGLACLALVACGQPNDDPDAAMPTADQVQATASTNEATEVPDWLPEAIVLPEDFQTVTVRSIGSKTRLLQGSTEADADAVLQRNVESLSNAGYTVRRLEADLTVRFDGQGYEQGKIAIIDTYEDMGRTFQVDVTLASP